MGAYTYDTADFLKSMKSFISKNPEKANELKEMPVQDKRVLFQQYDSSGKKVIFQVYEDLTIQLNPALEIDEATVRFWESCTKFLEKSVADNVSTRNALVHCVAAMKGAKIASSKEEIKENDKLWDKAVKMAEKCFK